MSENNPQSQLRENLIDALLHSAFETDAGKDSQSIENVMRKIDSLERESSELKSGLEDTLNVLSSKSMTETQRQPVLKKWISWTIAALAVIAVGIAYQSLSQSNHAMATVERSLAAAKDAVARHYRVSVATRNESSGVREIESDLYVQGLDLFALRHPALIPGKELWLGRNETDSWFIPSIGPIRVGDAGELGNWIKKRELRQTKHQRETLSTPFLHIESALVRMQDGYHLIQKPDATLTLDDGSQVICEHIVGELKLRAPSAAANKIELWCDKDSGVAMRLEGTWNEPVGRFGREKVSIIFVSSDELPENWFTAAGHYEGFRRKHGFDLDEE